MCGLSDDRFTAAVAAIDAANADDPTTVAVRTSTHTSTRTSTHTSTHTSTGPLARVHGQLAAEWVRRLDPAADDTVVLAARAHHLRRWELPRTSYPEGRAGYLRWRRDQKRRHADDVEGILRSAGYADDEIARVQALVRREGLGTDPDTQLVEDAACLVFVETQLADVADRLDRDHLIEVIRKTSRKMSPAALDAVATLDLDDVERELLAAAFDS